MEKGTNYFISYGLNSTTTIFLKGWLLHKETHENWYAIKKDTKPSQTINLQQNEDVLIALF